VSVVIPTLNEAANLPHVFSRLPVDLFEVVLVDGGSTDDTVDVARRLWPGVRVVGQTRRGKGNALLCGFAAARGDVIVMLDADGSADPAEIERYVEVLVAGADFAKGSRFLPGGGSSDITMVRRLGNWILSRAVNVLFRTRYTDLCYGYNAFWADTFPAVPDDCDGFEIETMINIRIAQAGLAVVEVASFEHERIHGESNLSAVRDGWRIFKVIVGQRWKRRAAAEGRHEGSAAAPRTHDHLRVAVTVPTPEPVGATDDAGR